MKKKQKKNKDGTRRMAKKKIHMNLINLTADEVN